MRTIDKKGPLNIITVGHPNLRKKSQILNLEQIQSKEVQKFIDDFILTLRNSGYGAALAANQVNKLWQIIVIELNKMPLEILINPQVLKFAGEKVKAYEGCLSVPGYLGVVGRSDKVVVEALNREGKKIKIKASGFHARVLQHEIDHLNGILYIDRMIDVSSLITEEEFDKLLAEKEKEIA